MKKKRAKRLKIKVKPSECPYYRVDRNGVEFCEFPNYLLVNPPGIIFDTVVEIEGEDVIRREKAPYPAVSLILTNYPLYRNRSQDCNPKHCFGRLSPLFYQIMLEAFESGLKKSIMVTEEVNREALADLIDLLRGGRNESNI